VIVSAHHTGFHVADLERSLRFYRDLLGLEVLAQRTITEPYIGELVGYEGVELRSAFLRIGHDDHVLELIEYRNVPRTAVDPQSANPGTAHICLVVEDLPAVYRLLVEAGTQSISPDLIAPTHGPNVGRRVVYMADPDGIRVELLGAELDAAAQPAS
jgi:catechol 2,3-dioxygenase-like lactoylglutathione lyase family enzyme